MARRRIRVEVRGIVQGVGFRPFVYNLALRHGLVGFVRNHSSGVSIEAEGKPEDLEAFLHALKHHPPPAAQIDWVGVESVALQGESQFRIEHSQVQAAASTPISPDLATCQECLREFSDPRDRRFRYPFINCTNCGPRYTIVRDIPYDRPNTTMASFRMCRQCQQEYEDPSNRRYHAQPNACARCGPQVWFVWAQAPKTQFLAPSGDVPRGQEAVEEFHRLIDQGGIVAVKGIGGFHLACLATEDRALATLRRRKGRVDKPFALMVPDLPTAHRLAQISPDEERLLCSVARPIVLLRRKVHAEVSPLVAPNNPFLGIMLPYSALHVLLLEGRVLVMTSGNRSEEPIARTNTEAFDRLRCLADAFLLHDREIFVVCDDSVTRVFRGVELPVRRSRGYAPMPIRLAQNAPPVLAVGGELKATFCITKGPYAYMSPHVGDMGNLETLQALQRAVEHFLRLFRVQPQWIACDMHPGYLSTHWAKQFALAHNLPLLEVQHHHAHVAGTLLEYQVDPSEEVLGVSFDGTGFGTDGAIWGGEFLLATWGRFRRVAQLKYIPLPGGDAAIRHPWRVALAHLWASGVPWYENLPPVKVATSAQRKVLLQQLQENLNCVPTSSMGRLFDAVAALLGVRQTVSYEAQAAMEMEALCTNLEEMSPYPFEFTTQSVPWQLDPQPMWKTLVQETLAGKSPQWMATRFHRTVGQMILEICQRVHQQWGVRTVVLSGGVFQNVTLLHFVVDRLEHQGFRVLVPRQVPPNDGGLALGQVAVALARLHELSASPSRAKDSK